MQPFKVRITVAKFIAELGLEPQPGDRIISVYGTYEFQSFWGKGNEVVQCKDGTLISSSLCDIEIEVVRTREVPAKTYY